MTIKTRKKAEKIINTVLFGLTDEAVNKLANLQDAAERTGRFR